MFEHKIVLMASREPARQSPEPRRREFYEALGRAVKASRAEQGIERKDLARRAGISYPYLAEIEQGTKRPSADALIPIAQQLGIKQSELLLKAERLMVQRPPSGKLAIVPRRRAPRPNQSDRESEPAIQELMTRVTTLATEDVHLVLDLVRRLAS